MGENKRHKNMSHKSSNYRVTKVEFELQQLSSREHGFGGYVLQYLKDSERIDTECGNSKTVEEEKGNKK